MHQPLQLGPSFDLLMATADGRPSFSSGERVLGKMAADVSPDELQGTCALVLWPRLELIVTIRIFNYQLSQLDWIDGDNRGRHRWQR